MPDETETNLPEAAETDAAAPAADGAEKPAAAAQDPLEQAKAEQAKLKDQLLRTLADFDNFRKRSRRELVDAERRGRDELLKEFLPVFDNLDRASLHAETATDTMTTPAKLSRRRSATVRVCESIMMSPSL